MLFNIDMHLVFLLSTRFPICISDTELENVWEQLKHGRQSRQNINFKNNSEV